MPGLYVAPGRGIFFVCITFFFCVPKRRSKKRAPVFHIRLWRIPEVYALEGYFSLSSGRKKTRLRLRQSESALTFYVFIRQQL